MIIRNVVGGFKGFEEVWKESLLQISQQAK